MAIADYVGYYLVTVTRVVDGDTIEGDILLPEFNETKHVTIRLNGINAPETRTSNKEEKAKGLKSKHYLSDLILNKELFVKIDGKGSFSRLLGTFYLEGLNINEHLVELGYAKHKEY